jgi:TPR repeat protein
MEQHDADSMFQLGEIARSGRYGDPDYERSYFWHFLAARHGQKQSVAKVEWLKQNLTTEQIRNVTDALARSQSR